MDWKEWGGRNKKKKKTPQKNHHHHNNKTKINLSGINSDKPCFFIASTKWSFLLKTACEMVLTEINEGGKKTPKKG